MPTQSAFAPRMLLTAPAKSSRVFELPVAGRRSRQVMSVFYRPLRDLDWPLLIVTLILCGSGVLQIYSATQGTKWADAWWKQIVWVARGW